MSAPVASSGPRLGGRGRALTALVVVLAVVVLLVLVALAAPARRNDGPALDPTSTGATGTRAAVEVAERLGADVVTTSEPPSADVDVALVFEDLLDAESAAPVLEWVADGGTLVVAAPDSPLTPDARPDTTGELFADSQVVDRGRCDADRPAGLAALRELRSFGPVERFEVPAGATSCFADGGGAVVVVTPTGRGLVVAVGTPWVFTNEALDQADDAGLLAALAVPEPGTRLAVLVAGRDDEGFQPPEGGSLVLPTGVELALVQLLVAAVVYALFRARRLGRPVPEDQAVVIAGAELTRAVGGLMEHAGTRDRAAASLRRAARARLGAAHGLAPGSDGATVAAAVSSRSDVDPDRLERALVDAPVADDAALAALGRELDRLVADGLARPAPSPHGPGSDGGADLAPPPASPGGPQ